MSQVTVESTIAGALTQGCFSSQKYVDTVPRKRAHTPSVNRKGTPGLFITPKGELWPGSMGRRPWTIAKMELPSSELVWAWSRGRKGESRRGRDKMFRKVKEGGVK